MNAYSVMLSSIDHKACIACIVARLEFRSITAN